MLVLQRGDFRPKGATHANTLGRGAQTREQKGNGPEAFAWLIWLRV